MNYKVSELAKLSGISARALRLYDKKGLLCPKRISTNGYRVYGDEEIDRLQQILFFRELGIGLDEIKAIINAKEFDKESALESHLVALYAKKEQIEELILNVKRSLSAMKGEIKMSESEKFMGFKEKLITENEERYGAEAREKYGNEAIDASNSALMNMNPSQYERSKELNEEVSALLKAAMKKGDPACEEAQKACESHKKWLMMFWKKGSYSKAAHRALGELYVSDERFKAYYENINPGAAEFFKSALELYCAE